MTTNSGYSSSEAELFVGVTNAINHDPHTAWQQLYLRFHGQSLGHRHIDTTNHFVLLRILLCLIETTRD
jgi:hypothetical protein